MPLINLEDVIPHRDGMLLIGRILEVDEEKAVSESTATEKWPLVTDGYVNSLVIIELAAQTTSACIGWKKKLDNSLGGNERGWLVGIKTMTFEVAEIPLHTRLITRVQTQFSFDNYTGISGTVETDDALIGSVHLQVMKSQTDSVLDATGQTT
jgi:predicted hotdog family 3-hydroxylacyl-ACP dehydratase